LADCWLETDDERRIDGDQMRRLCESLAAMEEALVALERRGVSLKIHAERLDPETMRLPIFLLTVGNDTHWFHNRDALEGFIERENLTLEGKDESSDDEGSPSPEKEEKLLAHFIEMHEVKTINAGLKELVEHGFTIQDLIPQQRTGSTESKFHLNRDENRNGIDNLRALLPAVRAAGEKGMQVTRFKGLGEMNPEELRETTLDRSNRTLVKVSLPDAAAADEMFRVLMGDKVEPRRHFIEKHALDVRNLDV
jgi:DNA gyrase subunit B